MPGEAEHNKWLSRKRTEVVKFFMKNINGNIIPVDQIFLKANGQTSQFNSGYPDANRRVDIIVEVEELIK